jgi:hypothetical protein
MNFNKFSHRQNVLQPRIGWEVSLASNHDRNGKLVPAAHMDLTLVQLASRWGCTIASLHERCEKGQIPHFRIGELYCFPLSLVEEFEARLLKPGRTN